MPLSGRPQPHLPGIRAQFCLRGLRPRDSGHRVLDWVSSFVFSLVYNRSFPVHASENFLGTECSWYTDAYRRKRPDVSRLFALEREEGGGPFELWLQVRFDASYNLVDCTCTCAVANFSREPRIPAANHVCRRIFSPTVAAQWHQNSCSVPINKDGSLCYWSFLFFWISRSACFF